MDQVGLDKFNYLFTLWEGFLSGKFNKNLAYLLVTNSCMIASFKVVRVCAHFEQ